MTWSGMMVSDVSLHRRLAVFVCFSSRGCPASAEQHMPLACSCQCPLCQVRLLLCSHLNEANYIWRTWPYLPLLENIRVLANLLPYWDSSRTCQLHVRLSRYQLLLPFSGIRLKECLKADFVLRFTEQRMKTSTRWKLIFCLHEHISYCHARFPPASFGLKNS